MADTQQPTKGPATWRIILAAILDFFTAFFGCGYLVAALTGGLTDDGFHLTGWPALAGLVLVVLYFVIFNKFFGGTVWKWILGARRSKS